MLLCGVFWRRNRNHDLLGSVMRALAMSIDVRTYLPKINNEMLFLFFFILRRMGKNKALAHHTSTYLHTRRVSI